MTREAAPIDISAMPELVRLAEEVARTHTPRLLKRGDEDLAVLAPAGRTQRRRGTARTRLVDTTALPPVPYLAVDEMLASRPPWRGRAFTDEEIRAALEEERIEAWRRKSS